jgi:AcrR family transcriptional regulator
MRAEIADDSTHGDRHSIASRDRLAFTRMFVDAEFDRFVSDLLPQRRVSESTRTGCGEGAARGPRPSITMDAIVTRAMIILDDEGDRALTARRLALDLGISTRTLYKRIHNRENLLRKVSETYASRMSLPNRGTDSLRSAARRWCEELYDELASHPVLAALLGQGIHGRVAGGVSDLVDLAVAEGIPRDRAIDGCNALVTITVNGALAGVGVAPVAAPPAPHKRARAGLSRELERALDLVIDGMQSRL